MPGINVNIEFFLLMWYNRVLMQLDDLQGGAKVSTGVIECRGAGRGILSHAKIRKINIIAEENNYALAA